jgi:RNA polymerase sigma-70 factor (ECF subfamily)
MIRSAEHFREHETGEVEKEATTMSHCASRDEPGLLVTELLNAAVRLFRDPADPQAWQAFVERYGPKVLMWCRQWRLQPADAEDVAQEVLHRLARYLHGFRYDPAKGHFRGWLKTVARNAWSDLCESRRRAGWGSGDPHIHRLLQNQEARDGLAETLHGEFTLEVYAEAKARVQWRVSRTSWQAFELLAEEGWSGARVATYLHLSVAAVYMTKKRVQRMLAEEIHKLERLGPEEEESTP